MQTIAGRIDRIVRAVFWGGLAGTVVGVLGGLVAGLAQQGTYISLLTPLYVSNTTIAVFFAAFMLFVGPLAGGLVGLITGAINRPKLTWLLGLLLGLLAGIVFRLGTSLGLVLTAIGLTAAVVAGWRMTPRSAK